MILVIVSYSPLLRFCFDYFFLLHKNLWRGTREWVLQIVAQSKQLFSLIISVFISALSVLGMVFLEHLIGLNVLF